MSKATRSLASNLYAAYLMAAGFPGECAYVFRGNLKNGEDWYFASAGPAPQVGHDDLLARLPKSRRTVGIRTLVVEATVYAQS